MQRHDRGTGYYIQWFCPKPFRCHITDLPGIPTFAGKEFILPHAHSITSDLRVNLSLASKAVNGHISQVIDRLTNSV